MLTEFSSSELKIYIKVSLNRNTHKVKSGFNKLVKKIVTEMSQEPNTVFA